MSSNLQLLVDLASVERTGQGRECYAFSDIEDKVIAKLENYATYLIVKYNIDEGDFEIERDALGSLFVTFYGEDRTKSVVSGSHVDSVLNGGDYDGLAGVNSAFSMLEKLLIAGEKPQVNFMAVAFRAEESSPKTEMSCLGSLVATGLLTKERLESVTYLLDDGRKVLLKDYFSDKYGQDRWEKVLEELENPPLKKDQIVAYEELHIEQSAVCEGRDIDVGIVTDGIGGAIREKVEFVLKDDICGELEIGEENPYLRYIIEIKGKAAHTGGTPPNRKLKKRFIGNECWYRTDALLAAGQLLKILDRYSSRMMRNHAEIKCCGISVPKETGFTTVPERQCIELAVDEGAWIEFEMIFANLCPLVEKNTGVEISYTKEKFQPGKVKYYQTELFRAFDIPNFVERVIRETIIARSTPTGVGKVRGTATDFALNDGKVKFNLDYRDVDTKKIEELVRRVREKIEWVGTRLVDGENHEFVMRLFDKEFVPLDEDAVAVKKQVVESLGLKYVEMPSLPGHDAGCLGFIGVPVAMTYVRHNGVSHNSDESMDPGFYKKAEQVSHGYLESLLKKD